MCFERFVALGFFYSRKSNLNKKRKNAARSPEEGENCFWLFFDFMIFPFIPKFRLNFALLISQIIQIHFIIII